MDFVLSGKDTGSGPTNTTFTLNLEEARDGEVMVGKNVPLVLASPGAAQSATPRQDVGMKVKARFFSVGDDLLLEVQTEMSAFEPPSTIRKILARGNALATAGKPTMVVSLDDDHKGYDLTVTPTRLR